LKKIAVISLIDIIPINSGGKAGTFYIVDTLSREFNVDFYYFERRENSIGLIPKYNFNRIYLESNQNLILPKFIKNLHAEYLIFGNLKNKLKNIKCDIVYLDFPYLYHIAKFVSKNNNNAPIILVEHNIEWQYQKQSGNKLWYLIKLWENFVIKAVDLVICVSRKDYDYWITKYPKKNIFYIEHGVIEEIFNPHGKKFNFPKDNFNLLFYGKLDSPQNLEALKFIVNKIAPVVDKDVIINIFGSGKIEKNFFKHQKIKYYGIVENPAEYIRGADLVIVPLFNSAGVKMRILESLYCGKVVLATKQAVEGIPEVLKNLVIICNNEKDFSKYISYFKKHRDILAKKEKKITQVVESYKKINKNKLLNIFKNTLNGV